MNVMVKRLFQEFIRAKQISIAWLLLVLGELAVCCYAVWDYTAGGQYTNAVQASFSAVPFVFALFLYLGYELTALLYENNLWECLHASKQLNKVIYGLFVVIGTLAATTLFVLLLFNFVFYGIAHGGLGGALFQNVVISHMLYYFLTPLAGGLLGIFVAIYLKQRRLIVYLITIILILLNTTYWEKVLLLPWAYTNSDQMTKALFVVKDFCTLSPLGLKENFTMDPVYGMPIELIRWMLVIFWLSLPLGGILWKTMRGGRKKLFCVLGCGLVCLACLAGYLPPGSRIVLDNRPTSYFNADQFYYLDHAEDVTPIEQANFAIKNYKMDLKILKILKARVTMELEMSQPDLNELAFTLYHNYKVKKFTTRTMSLYLFAKRVIGSMWMCPALADRRPLSRWLMKGTVPSSTPTTRPSVCRVIFPIIHRRAIKRFGIAN